MSVPLPEGWTQHLSPKGVPYFFHKETKKSTYKHPGLPEVAPIASTSHIPPSQPVVVQSLPPLSFSDREQPIMKLAIPKTPLLRILTDKDNVFYYDTITGISTWELPVKAERAVWDWVKMRRSIEENGKPAQAETAEESSSEDEEEEEDEEDVVNQGPEVDGDYDTDDSRELEEYSVHSESPPPESRPQDIEPQAKARPIYAREEGIKIFNDILVEKKISPMWPFEYAQERLEDDDRWHAVHERDAKIIFEEYCASARDKSQKGPVVTDPESSSTQQPPNPKEDFYKLLKATVASTRTLWPSYRDEISSRKEYKAWQVSDDRKRKAFEKWLYELGEAKRKANDLAEQAFRHLLEEQGPLTGKTLADIQDNIEHHPSYLAVSSNTRKKQLFADVSKQSQ